MSLKTPNKKVLVVSHERSGTSFLINAIAANFPIYLPEMDSEGKPQRVDLDRPGWNFADPEEMMKFLSDSQFHDLPLANIFKSHHPFGYFWPCPIWDYLLQQFHVFYIYRDGRDVLTSYWRHCRKQGFLWGPQTFAVGEFLRAKPSGGACRYHGPRPPANMVQRWNDHIVSWMKERKEGVTYICYEEMVDSFDSVVQKIALELEISFPERVVRPNLGGVHPWRGYPGNWKEFFDESDESFFMDNARTAHGCLEQETSKLLRLAAMYEGDYA